MLGRHRPDHDIAAFDADAFEACDRAEINEMRRAGEPELHHGNKAMPTGERPSVLAKLSEQAHGFTDGGGTMVGKRPRYHGLLPGTWTTWIDGRCRIHPLPAPL